MNINLTLFGQLLMFGAFIWFCKEYIWPPLVKAMDDRRSEIEKSLSLATKSRKELQKKEIEGLNIVLNAKEESKEIISTAEDHSRKIIEAAKSQAERKASDIIAAAEKSADDSISRAKKGLSDQYANLVFMGVEEVIKRDVDRDSHSSLIDSLRVRIANDK